MVDLWDEELQWEPGEILAFHTLPPLAPRNSESPSDYHRRIEAQASQLRGCSALTLTIGGEHSITAPTIRGLASSPESLTVVQFDAHADLLDTFQGTRASHGCVMRRIWEAGAHLIQIGIRTLDRSEYEFLTGAERVETYYGHHLQEQQELEKLSARLEQLAGDVYLTIDVDCFDGATVPSTGTPQHLVPSEATRLGLLHALLLKSQARLVAVDIVETIPGEHVRATEFNVAKLAFKIVSYSFYAAGTGNDRSFL